MIYDCFQFNGEYDLLEIRLNHHSAFVDKFILTESPYTYSGKEKRLYYDEVKNKEPFSAFKHRIIHRIYDVPPKEDCLPNGRGICSYEHDQRNYLKKYNFEPDDLIIYCDCDEIIRSGLVIQKALECGRIVSLDMALNWYYFNCVMAPDSDFQDDYSMEKCFNRRWRMGKIVRPCHLNVFTNLYELRQLYLWDRRGEVLIEDAGWHFSNLGSAESIKRKFDSFSHSDELNNKYYLTADAIEGRKMVLRDPLGRNVRFVAAVLDVPPYIINNAHKYKDYILDA